MLSIFHTADLHLDAPFAGLTPEQGALRRDEQRKLLLHLAQLCREKSCDLWLMAGDVFDGTSVRPETVEALQTAFAQCGAQVFVAPGNHDPYTPASPWHLADFPENVHIFSGDMEAVALPELQCRVWGAGFRGQQAFDLLRPIPENPDGFWEIGVFHGDPLYPSVYHPIAKQTLQTCGLDYLALGHIHKTALPKQAGRTWYGWPGAGVARGFDETGARCAFSVELSENGCVTEPIVLPGLRYEVLTVPAGDDPETAVKTALPVDSRETVCRVTLTGETEPFDREALEQTLSELCFALELRDETTPPRAIWADCGEETLRGLALSTLKQQLDNAQSPQEARELALAARYVLAALEGREEP